MRDPSHGFEISVATKSLRNLWSWHLTPSPQSTMAGRPWSLPLQWFIKLLEALSPIPFIYAFIEPFIVGRINKAFSSYSKHMFVALYRISARTSQAESEGTNYMIGVN